MQRTPCAHSVIVFALTYFFPLCTAPGLSFDIIKRQILNKNISYVNWHTQAEAFENLLKIAYAPKHKWLKQETAVHTLNRFTPFVQKRIISEHSTVAFFSDLHGNSQGLLNILQTLVDRNYLDQHLKIINPHYYLIFLGNYVDRGPDGLGVLYLLMLLKIHNPYNVYILRGNHEDRSVNQHYGFGEEVSKRYGVNALDLVTPLYNLMPVGLYIGVPSEGSVDYIQCCHGGIELGYSPKLFLSNPQATFEKIDLIDRSPYIRELPNALKQSILTQLPKNQLDQFAPLTPSSPHALGFLWHDFVNENNLYPINNNIGRGWSLDQSVTQHFLQNQSGHQHQLRIIIRGHQYHGTLLEKLIAHKGLASLYNEKVYTILSVPIAHNAFTYTSITFLQTNKSFNQWHIYNILV